MKTETTKESVPVTILGWIAFVCIIAAIPLWLLQKYVVTAHWSMILFLSVLAVGLWCCIILISVNIIRGKEKPVTVSPLHSSDVNKNVWWPIALIAWTAAVTARLFSMLSDWQFQDTMFYIVCIIAGTLFFPLCLLVYLRKKNADQNQTDRTQFGKLVK